MITPASWRVAFEDVGTWVSGVIEASPLGSNFACSGGGTIMGVRWASRQSPTMITAPIAATLSAKAGRLIDANHDFLDFEILTEGIEISPPLRSTCGVPSRVFKYRSNSSSISSLSELDNGNSLCGAARRAV